MSLPSSSVLTPDLCASNFISPDSSESVVFGLLSKNLEWGRLENDFQSSIHAGIETQRFE
jgi:hypothetical protein